MKKSDSTVSFSVLTQIISQYINFSFTQIYKFTVFHGFKKNVQIKKNEMKIK